MAPRTLHPSARWISVAVLGIVVLAAGVWFFQMITPFLMTLFVAGVLTLLIKPAHERLLARMPRQAWLAALIVCLLVIGTLVLPLMATLAVLIQELAFHANRLRDWAAVTNFQDPSALLPWQTSLPPWLLEQFSRLGGQTEELRRLGMSLATSAGQFAYEHTTDFLVHLPWILVKILIFTFALFFFLLDGERLFQGWKELSPLRDDHHEVIAREFATVCRGVVWGSFLAGLAQGLILAIAIGLITLFSPLEGGSWIVLLGAGVVVLSMVPFLGAAAVWVPTAVVFALQGFVIEAIVLTLVGALLISTIDNLIKIWVIKDAASLHPLFAFICVFGGLKSMGILGVFVGPMLGAVLFALVRVLREDVVELLLPEKSSR